MRTRRRHISAHTGKLEFEYERLSERAKVGDDRAIYVITREQIEGHDIATLLGTFSPSNDPESLRKMRGNVIIAVDGYRERPESLCAIPEVRSYFQQAHRWLQCWTFFSDLQSHSLAMIACCLMDNTKIAQREDQLVLTMKVRELDAIRRSCQPTEAYLHSQAGIRKPAEDARSKAVSFYLQLLDR